jgi:hypothetical protein
VENLVTTSKEQHIATVMLTQEEAEAGEKECDFTQGTD